MRTRGDPHRRTGSLGLADGTGPGGDGMTTTDESGRDTGTRSLVKALRLLREAGAFGTEGARLTDLATRTDLGPSTAHRMLKCLVDLGYLHKDGRSRYHLGRQVFDLGLLAARRFDRPTIAAEPLARLAETTGDIAVLTTRNGLDTVCLERRDGPRPVEVPSFAPGTRRPLGIGADGAALLAAMPPAEADAILEANDRRLRTLGPDGPERARRAVDAARIAGHATSDHRSGGNVAAVAIVVPADGPVPYLAVGVVGVDDDLRLDRLPAVLAALATAAREVAAAIRATG